MFFGEKLVTPDNYFSSQDLMQYIELLIKETNLQEQRNSPGSNYGWLKSKNIMEDDCIDLEKYENMVAKLTSESCAAVAVKLDRLVDEVAMSSHDILTAFQKLLEEQQNIQLIENVRVDKERGKGNKVFPELGDRRSTVSFILS